MGITAVAVYPVVGTDELLDDTEALDRLDGTDDLLDDTDELLGGIDELDILDGADEDEAAP